MKQKLFLLFGMIASFALITSFTSPTSNNIQYSLPKTFLTGNWVITEYNDNGKDLTETYRNYEFSFTEDGNIQVLNNETTYDGYYAEDRRVFVLKFGDEPNLSVLNGNWTLKYRDEYQVTLNDEFGRLLNFMKL